VTDPFPRHLPRKLGPEVVPGSTFHHRVFHDTGCLPPFDARQTRELFVERELLQLLAYLDARGGF